MQKQMADDVGRRVVEVVGRAVSELAFDQGGRGGGGVVVALEDLVRQDKGLESAVLIELQVCVIVYVCIYDMYM